jgi:hypothetical protein
MARDASQSRFSRIEALPIVGAGFFSPTVLAVSAAGLALTVALALSANRYSLWTDEAGNALILRRPLEALLATLVRAPTVTESGQPLYNILLWFWIRVAGDSEAALRLPSLMFSLATVVVLGLAWRELGVDSRFAWMSAASVLALPVMQWYALEARAYALIMLCASLHILVSLQCLRASWIRPRILGVLTIIAALSFTIAGIAALLAYWAVVAVKWRQARTAWRRSHRLEVAFLLAIPSAMVALTVLSSVSNVGSLGAYRAPIGLTGSLQALAFSLYELILGRSTGFSVVEIRGLRRLGEIFSFLESNLGALVVTVTVVLGTAAIVFTALRGISLRRDQRVLTVTGSWLLLGVFFCAYALYPGFLLLGRHLLFAFPSVVLLLGLGLSRSPRRLQLAAGLFIWCLGAVSFAGFASDGRYAKEDFRSVARVVGACQFQPQQLFLLSYEPGFAYYGIPGYQGVLGEMADISGAISFLRSAGSQPAMVVVDSSRFDPRGTIEAEVRSVMPLNRRDVPSLTMLSTLPLDNCVRR